VFDRPAVELRRGGKPSTAKPLRRGGRSKRQPAPPVPAGHATNVLDGYSFVADDCDSSIAAPWSPGQRRIAGQIAAAINTACRGLPFCVPGAARGAFGIAVSLVEVAIDSSFSVSAIKGMMTPSPRER
jgi:hypothetical protein